MPSVKACLGRSQKSVCYVSQAVVYEGGIHAPYTHSKRDHSADPNVISAKSITSKVCCFDSHTTQVFTLRLNSSTTWWLCFPGLPYAIEIPKSDIASSTFHGIKCGADRNRLPLSFTSLNAFRLDGRNVLYYYT